MNSIRRSNPALQYTRNLRLLSSSNDSILFYGKWTEDRSNVILVAVNLDPFRTQESMVSVPIQELGIGTGDSYAVLDLLTQKEFMWKGESNYVKLDPNDQPAHVLQVLRK
jgi:starch synthase (maltosyl-transferring)